MFCKWYFFCIFISFIFCFERGWKTFFDIFRMNMILNYEYGNEVFLLRQNKKYALRKTAAYGLVSCAVGLMLVGSAPIRADESASSTDAISTVEDTQDISRITDVLNGQVQGYIQASKPLTGNDFIVDADVAPDKLPAIEHYKTIFNQIPASYRRLVTNVQFIHAEDAILGDTSSSRAIKIRANYIHPDQTPDFSDGLATMFHELGHVIDFASIQGSGDSLWSISRDPYMRNLLEKTYPNNVKYVYESFADAFGSWLKYRVLGESDSNMQDLYNQFDSLFGDFIFNSPYNNDDNVTERTYKESTVFNWTGTFKSDKGEQLHDDAHLSAFYERVIHEANNSKTADQWTLVNRTFDHMEDLHLENHRFFGYGEPNTYAVGGNVFTVPGRIGDYYLASYSGNKMSRIGQSLWYTWQDNIYNEIGKQGATAGGVTNFVYRQKDTKITLRLIDSEHPEKVYHTVEVPAFTNYEHNGLDTHVFDSFKSEGELLDNLPNEVALENEGKTIDIRLKKNEEFTTTVKVKNEKGDVLKEVQVTGKHDSTNRIDYGDLSEINKEYDTSNLPDTLRIDKDQSVVEYVVPSRKNASVNVVLKNSSGDTVKTFSYEGKVGDTISFDNIKRSWPYESWTEPITDVPEPIVLKETNEDIVIVLKDEIYTDSSSDMIRPHIDFIGMTDHFTLENIDGRYWFKPSTDKPEGTFYPLMYGGLDIRNYYLVNGTSFYIWAADKGQLDDLIAMIQSDSYNWGDLRAEDLLYGIPKEYDTRNDLSITYDYNRRTDEYTFKDVTTHSPRTKIEIPILKDYDLYYIPNTGGPAVIDANVLDRFVKIEKPLSFWNRPSDEKIQEVLKAHKNEKFASRDDMVDALIKLMYYTEDNIGLSDGLKELFTHSSNTMPFMYIPSEHTIHAKIVNERGEVLKDVPVTGRGNDVVDIPWGSLSDLEPLYDLSDVSTTHHIPLHDAQDITFVVRDKEDAYTAEWKVFDSYDVSPNFDTPIASGKVTGKYGEKLSDKLDLSQYHIDKFSTNRLNRYRFGIELVSGDTLPNKTMYTFFAPPKPVKKCNVYIQYVDDKDALVYPTKRLILEEGQSLRDYVISSSLLLGNPTPSDNQFNLGDTLDGDDSFTLSNKEDVLNYTVNDSGDQIVKVIYNRKDVNGQATFKDALGREIHQTIDYQGKMYDKLSDETVEQIRQALLANKENHPDVFITLGGGKQYTDSDTFLNDLPNLRFGDGVSRIKVQYGTTITKTYDLATETSFTRLLIPDTLNVYINHLYKDAKPDNYGLNYYPKSSGDLYGDNTPYITGEYDFMAYRNRSLVLSFIHSLGSLASDEYIKETLSTMVDTTNLPSNPTIRNTQSLTLTAHVTADGQVTVSDVQVGEKQGDSPVSLQVPGFDMYILPQSLNNRGRELRYFIKALHNAELSEEVFKLDDGVDYQLGSGLTTKDIQTLKDNLRETGKLANFTEDSLDNLVHQKLNTIGEPLNSKLQLDGNHVIQKVADQSFLFLLAPKIYHNKVKVVNEDGEVLLEKTLTTKFKDTVHYDMTEDLRTIENDYVTMDAISGSWTANTENQEIVIHAKKRFVPKTETKQVKRLVRFHDGKQVVGEEEQVVTFTRTVTTDRKTDEVTYSDWESEHPQFDELKVAEKEDKTSNVQFVPVKTVTVDDKDEIVDVYYGPKMVDGDTQTKASIHVTYKYQDGTIYKEFDVQADKGSVLDGSDLEMLPDNMNFTDEFTTYEVKGDGTDVIERTVKKNTSDSGTQTKATIHVVYKNADGTVYKEFDVQADKGTVLDGSDLEMLPDDMDFTDDFITYEVKGDGTDHIERTVKKQTSDSGTQTDTPDSKDNGTQTDNPDTSDGSTQTKAEIKVVYKNADGTVYKEFVVNADKGTILDASDLEMLSDDMDFDDDFMFYEVKGDGSDEIVRIVKKHVSDEGTQTETAETNDGLTQTDEPSTSDNGTQTDNPSTNDKGSQTDNPDTSDGSTQTNTPDSKDNGTQTNKPNVSDKGSQTDKPDIKDDATQTDRPKDEPIQSVLKQDGISKAKPLSNKVVNDYTGVQPIKSVAHLPSKERLPKAGSVDNSKLGLIGAAMSMLGSILGFVIYRKKH